MKKLQDRLKKQLKQQLNEVNAMIPGFAEFPGFFAVKADFFAKYPK